MKKPIKTFHYPGAKNNSGFFQFFMNILPKHSIFIEGCAGSGVIAANIYDRSKVILIEIDDITEAQLRKTMPPAISIRHTSIFKYIDEHPEIFSNPSVVLYLDPPYPFPARRSGANLYRHEWSLNDHRKMIRKVRHLKCKIMISTRQNDLYSRCFAGWHQHNFYTVDRAGGTVEIVYTNFDPATLELFSYDYLGRNFVERQFLSRQCDRMKAKFQKLKDENPHQFQRILKSLNTLK